MDPRGDSVTLDRSKALLDYLRFRHVFRNAYSFDLHWEKMAWLVLNAESTLTRLEQELDALLAQAPDAPPGAPEGSRCGDALSDQR